MKRILGNILFTSLIVLAIGCKKKDEPTTPPVGNKPVVELTGAITADRTLLSTEKYLLKGFVYVVAPAKLTIQPGTVIKGDKQSKGSLIIERGAQIIADGNATNPIVFTSNAAPGARAAGDWGGIIILGNAPENAPGTPIIEGGVDRPYGGTNPADNSGILRYVRIEFPGVLFSPNNEINGLTLGGVGSGTIIDHVQVSYSNDDSFEMFGGTVNCKYLIAHRGLDDDFDTDNGYAGKVQFGLVIRDPNLSDTSTGGNSNGFESDNDPDGTAATPLTSAIFSNISVFGPITPTSAIGAGQAYRAGIFVRRNTSISVFNSLVTGYPEGIRLDATSTLANANSGALAINNVVFAGNTQNYKAAGTGVTDADVQTYMTDPAKGNQVSALADLLLNANNFSLTAPSLLPQATSPLLTGAAFTNAKFSGDTFFDKTVTYRGAFGTTDWTTGWANFNPQQTPY